MTHTPKTLADKLTPVTPPLSFIERRGWMHTALFAFMRWYLILAIIAFPIIWIITRPDIEWSAMILLWGALFVLFILVAARTGGAVVDEPPRRAPWHILLAHDKQGFMGDLRLDAKTVVFDGSNIYHFGHDNGLDAQPLGMLAHQFRSEGYRIVCFFDANIYHRLSEHGAFPKGMRHRVELLDDVFGLGGHEVFVVPSKTQADKYVLETLKHLPISFAVSNDQFRDYAKKYPTVMKGNQWRKGVVISKSELKVLQHKLQAPILLR